MKRRIRMHCYVCGKPLGAAFYLFSMRDESDRVFLVGPKCLPRVEGDGVSLCAVERKKR